MTKAHCEEKKDLWRCIIAFVAEREVIEWEKLLESFFLCCHAATLGEFPKRHEGKMCHKTWQKDFSHACKISLLEAERKQFFFVVSIQVQERWKSRLNLIAMQRDFSAIDPIKHIFMVVHSDPTIKLTIAAGIFWLLNGT